MRAKILIADDHGVLRAGLRALLNAEPDLQVVGEAIDGEDALHKASELKPDIVLMDLSMPRMSGIEATRRLKELLPAVQVLILTVHEDTSLMREAIQVGASGYILKRAVESELINAIHSVMHGELYVHPAMTRALFSSIVAQPKSPTPTEELLTSREIDVLRLIIRGYTNRQIADHLSLSVRTVESHRASLMSKLNLHNRLELVRYGAEHGYFDPEEKKG